MKSGLQGALVLNLLGFCIWSTVNTKACSSRHPIVKALKAKLVKEWATIPLVTMRAACASFSVRLTAAVKNK